MTNLNIFSHLKKLGPLSGGPGRGMRGEGKTEESLRCPKGQKWNQLRWDRLELPLSYPIRRHQIQNGRTV